MIILNSMDLGSSEFLVNKKFSECLKSGRQIKLKRIKFFLERTKARKDL